MYRLISILFVLLFLPLFAKDQHSKEDIDSIIKESEKYYNSSKKDSSYIIANHAFELSKDINYFEGQVNALINKTRVQYDKRNFSPAIKNISLALKISDSIGYYHGEVQSLGALAKIHHRNKEYEKAFTELRKAFKLSKKENDSLRLATFNEHLSTLFRDIKQYDSSTYYVKQAIKINQETGNLRSLSFTYNNLGISQFTIFNNPDSSLYYFHKSRRLREKQGDLRNLIQSYNNLGYIFSTINQTDSAIFYLKRSIKESKNQMAVTYVNQTYENLITTYQEMGEMELALETAKEHTLLNDSINKVNSEKAIDRAIENEKVKLGKEEIKRLKAENRKEMILMTVLIVILLISVIISVLSRRRRIELDQVKEERLEEEQRREAAQGIIKAQEVTRNTIAKELHDGIGGSLAVLKLSLTDLQDYHQCPKIEKEVEILDDIYQEVRTLSHNITPIHLQNQSFTEALEGYIEQNKKTLEIFSYVDPKEEINNLDQDLLINLYRIVQEIFSNIIKHAKAKRVNIQILGNKDHLVIYVEDDGIGFDNNNNGIGLKNISQRAKLFNGSLSIESEKGKGSNITVTLKY